MSKIIDLLKELMNKNFWGEVTIRFKDGKPVFINENKGTKLD
jgi:hypothetical protein